MKPWKEVAVPHKDVLEGTFQQSEFAADLTAVRTGKATPEYRDAAAFYDRTFITEGMRLLLTQVAQRLAGQGGEPVIQLQTAFGGGKTHTMLAVYHLATRSCSLAHLTGIPGLLDQAKLMDVPQANVAVLDGNEHAPGQPWKHHGQTVNTLWGELAYQLGGADGYAMLRESDVSGTSPGKQVLQDLLSRYAPCVILIDELVAYVRQFAEGQSLSGGSYDTNMSFVQALTEAVKLVPNAIVLASLPESELEAGSLQGVAALRALEKTFGRVQALWKPVATEEAFEIVRRRLFEPIADALTRDIICRAFADAYVAEGAKLPSETQEARYFDRLVQAYPIHPEVFDRLYEDWSTIDGFQRTRGVLKLMAKVIFRLWKDDNRDLLIMPGSLPLYDGNTRNELTYYLGNGWDPVIERDIDGERAETTELEAKDTRFGQVNAARRVARSLFLGTAPASVSAVKGTKGLDRGRVLLGCLQPQQTSSVYSDALNRLADLLHYLNASGDKNEPTTRFWLDTRANLRREMADRKGRFDNAQIKSRVADALKNVFGPTNLFDGLHIFTPHSDVPDDAALRLVVLPLDHWYSNAEPRLAVEAVLEDIANNGTRPRYRGNRLLFVAADHGVVSRLIDAARAALAWKSIVEDINSTRLVVDLLQKRQAEQELANAESLLPRMARECYGWLLCPYQERAADPATVEFYRLATTGSTAGAEIERVCAENELVIDTWSPTHLRSLLSDLYWKPEEPDAGAMKFWEDCQRYLYLPRFKAKETLIKTLRLGAASRDFFGTAFGKTGEHYDGFALGCSDVQLDDTLLLIEPGAARAYEAAEELARQQAQEKPTINVVQSPRPPFTPMPGGGSQAEPPAPLEPPPPAPPSATYFHSTAEVPAAGAKMKLLQLAEEIIAVLGQDPNADVRVTVEITADFPNGVPDNIRRAVSENATALKLRPPEWE